MIIRQGDVLLVPVEVAMPHNARQTREVVLAEGEVTGHAHRLAAAEVYEWEANGQRYVRTTGIGTIRHEEHDPEPAAVIAPDVTYRVIQQRQWNLADEWEQVRD